MRSKIINIAPNSNKVQHEIGKYLEEMHIIMYTVFMEGSFACFVSKK